MSDAFPLRRAPCPFCGGTRTLLDRALRGGYQQAQEDPDAWAYTVRCLSCAATGPWFKREGNAVRSWNRRVPALEPPPAAPEGKEPQEP